ncbi:MAG: hypothetical protein ACJASU_001461 [Cognaticolwellia sp.]|jgi:hypothetical protein
MEWLWQVMNEQARNGKYFAKAKEFQQKINEFFTITLFNSLMFNYPF